MKNKFILLFLLSLACVSCNRQMGDFAPNHIGVSPSMEWEIQHGSSTKLKPKVQTSLDWNF